LKILLLFLLTFISCQSEKNPFEGRWKVNLEYETHTLPFILEIKNDSAILHNSDEKIKLEDFTLKNNELIIPMHVLDSGLHLKLKDETLTGNFIKYNIEPAYKIPLNGTRSSSLKKYNKTQKKLNEKFKIHFNDSGREYTGLGVFKTKDDIIKGTILTQSGDYRYLEGTIEGDKFVMSGFDGGYAIVIHGKILGRDILGTLYTGSTRKINFSATPTTTFKLPDANTVVGLKPNTEHISFKVKTLDDKEFSYDSRIDSSEITIIQIYGSWCPNCIDETLFLVDWHKKNPKAKIMALSFEASPTEALAKKLIKKSLDKFKPNYPFYLASYNKSKITPLNIIPQLNDFKAYPTMIIIKKGVVAKIHTGFSGPATGEYYQEFIKEFESITE